MSIFSVATLEYPGEREYIILAILSWVFRWTQQTVCRLMIKGIAFLVFPRKNHSWMHIY
jgi:hypothetical protein